MILRPYGEAEAQLQRVSMRAGQMDARSTDIGTRGENMEKSVHLRIAHSAFTRELPLTLPKQRVLDIDCARVD